MVILALQNLVASFAKIDDRASEEEHKHLTDAVQLAAASAQNNSALLFTP